MRLSGSVRAGKLRDMDAPCEPAPDADVIVARVAAAVAAVGADPKLAGPLLAAEVVVRVTTPDGEACTLTLGPAEVDVVAGLAERAPDVILEAEADVLDRVWSGEVDPGQAVGRRELVASGPVNEVLRTLHVLPRIAAAYRRLTRAEAADLLDRAASTS